ncbi:MAG: S-layer homology domain-containing protein [Clostridia bacterium]|nr:S-layer homology domain-containing protein [Clostridia bacterium]
MKRVLSLVLALSMVLSMFSFAFAGSNLKDIDGTEYEAAVEALVELGVVNGYTDGTYLPEKTVSRAEMAKLLVVAAGLEPAAEVAQGATRFSDVNGGWASGYINVASEYGYIVGYPDGTFQPDAQVTYAEAVTMALRVLGYRTVVESKGTWPTNYIARAQDLKMLDDISYGTYSDGAKRGNVAKLVWNMLRTKMWDVTSENETNGLNYSKSDIMLEVKFPDYDYVEDYFDSFDITSDGEVMITLEGVTGELEYLGNDFYTFVTGTEVEVLINTKDETLLTIVPTGDDKLVEGTKSDLEDDYEDTVPAGTYDYAYARVEKKDIKDSTLLTVNSAYVYEVKESSSSIKINGSSTKEKDYENYVVIKDGERVSYADVKAGDVLSEVTVDGNTFYIISTDSVEGKFTKYVDDDDDSILTIGGEKYTEAEAYYVENPEKDGEKKGSKLANASDSVRKDMKNEVVTAYLDFLGRVTRLDFDGKIGDDSTGDVKFYAIKSLVEKEKAGVYTISLENEAGEEEYKFEKNSSVAKDLYADDTMTEGTFVAVSFNDDGEITDIENVAAITLDGPDASEKDITYDEDEDDGYYQVLPLESAKYDKDEEKLVAGDDSILVDEDVILVTLTLDDNDTTKTSDDVYSVEFAEGLEALENIKDEEIVVIVDAAEKIQTAIYVIRFDDATNKDDIEAAKVESAKLNKLGTEYSLELDNNDDMVYRKSDNTELGDGIADYENGVILYSIKEDKDGDEYLIFEAGLTFDDIKAVVADDDADDYVDEVKRNTVSFEDEDVRIAKAYRDEMEDYLFVIIEVSDDEDADDEDVVTNVASPIKAEDISASNFEEFDRIIKDDDAKVIFIIRGLAEREEAGEPA